MKVYSIIWGFLLIMALVLVVISEQVDLGLQAKMVKEGGWVETASWISYFVAAIFVGLQMRRWPVRWSMLVCSLLLGMRELDLDKKFSTMGLFKARLYSSPEVPVWEKLVAALITAAIVATLFFLLKDHLKPFLGRLKKMEGPSLSFLLAGGALVFARTLDGFSRKLEPFGIEPTDVTNRIVESAEECFELTGALLIVVAAVGALNHRSK